MKMLKKGLAVALTAAMVVTMVPSGTDAAKKIKMSKSKATISVGETVKLSVKNARKNVKVTWKSSSAKVAKLARKTTKGTAANTVRGIKKGTAQITASCKVGRKQQSVKCKITVKDVTASASATPTAAGSDVATPTATAAQNASVGASATPEPAKETEAPTAKPSKRPTSTPLPSPEPTLTPMPDVVNAGDFEEVATDSAIKLDNSSWATAAGGAKYVGDKDYVVINDGNVPDTSQGAWDMPVSVNIKDGDLVSFRVQGYFLGQEAFRFWIGDINSGSCTPVMVVDKIKNEKEKIGECGYPCELDKDGNELTPDTRKGDGKIAVTANQLELNANDKGIFDIKFTFKAGTSQNDTKSKFPQFTLKGMINSHINGLIIKNVYLTAINDEPVSSENETVQYEDVDIDKVKVFGGEEDAKAVKGEDGSISYSGKAFDGLMIPLPAAYKAKKGEKVKVSIEYEGVGSKARMYLIPGTQDSAKSNIAGPTEMAVSKVFEATDAADYICIKAASGDKFTSLKIKKISIGKAKAAK